MQSLSLPYDRDCIFQYLLLSSISNFMMYFVMTRAAQRHEIGILMRSAAIDRKDMMHLVDGRISPFLETLLTQWMGGSVAVTSAFPRSSVGLVHGGAALISVIAIPCQFLMLRAVLPIRELGTAGKAARLFRLARHKVTSVLGKRKPSRDHSHEGLPLCCCPRYHYSRLHCE